MKFSEIVGLINAAPSAGFIGITDYVSQKGEVTSYIGQLGFDYGTAKQKAITELEKAVAEKSFDAITVSGQCNKDGMDWNPRKKSAPMESYTITYSPETVLETAKEILDGWKNPKERDSNKVMLSEKKNGLAYNTETGTFTFSLLVTQQTYKEEKSEQAKSELGIVEKVESKHPETKLKEIIRERFEKKLRTFELAQGKFKEVSIAGTRFKSDEILF